MSLIRLLAAEPWISRLGWTLLHFLWQGAAIAVVYAAARALARNAGPAVRYAVACGAMALMAGAPVATWIATAPPAATPDRVYRMVSAPPAPAPIARVEAGVPAAAPAPDYLPWVVAAWMAGAMVFTVRLAGGCLLAARLGMRGVRPAPAEWQQTFDRLARRLGVRRRVRLTLSTLVDAPSIAGWWKPVALVPAAALTGLAPEMLEALLAHELAHVRRHDYLVNVAQSAVEALLFYHPAVWWISSEMRAEREMCCDDAAVAASGDTLLYARALAEIASWRPALARPALSAAGGSLAARVARLLGVPRASGSNSAPAAVLATTLLLVAAYGVFAQSDARPAFAAASVKRNPGGARGMIVRPEPGGSLRAENAPLVLLIQNAYRLQAFQVVGGPSWINTDGYDIEAKPESQTDTAQTWKMLQTLLADRFQLAVHRETRDVSGYALTAARGESKLPEPQPGNCANAPADAPPPPPRPGTPAPCGRIMIAMTPAGVQLKGGKVAMPELTRILAIVLGRPVLDRTEVGREFDVSLTFTPDVNTAGLPGQGGPRDPGGPRLPTDPEKPNILAAIQEQLGLKLVAAKAPVEVLVIDRVERPTPN